MQVHQMHLHQRGVSITAATDAGASQTEEPKKKKQKKAKVAPVRKSSRITSGTTKQ